MKKRSTCPCGNAGKYRGDLSPNIRGHCETADCMPGCNLFTTWLCTSHLSSTAHGANLNPGLAETVWGEEAFVPPYSYASICLGHHENTSNLPRRFTSQMCPDCEQSNRFPGRDSLLPCSTSPGIQRDPGAGVSPLPNHRNRSIPQALCLFVRGNTNPQKITQEEEIKPASATNTTCQGSLCFHPRQHIPVPMSHAHVVPKANPKRSLLRLFGQHLMFSTQWWLCPSQLPTSTLAGAEAAVILAEAPPGPSAWCTQHGHLHSHLIPPKGLGKIKPSCWGSLKSQGSSEASSSPAAQSSLHWREAINDSKQVKANTQRGTTDLPNASSLLYPKEAHGLLPLVSRCHSLLLWSSPKVLSIHKCMCEEHQETLHHGAED